MRWIKLYTHHEQSEVFIDAGLWQLYTLLLFKACYAPTTFKGVELSQGECLLSLSQIQIYLQSSKPTIINRLKRLESLGYIKTRVEANVGTVISVTDYSSDGDECESNGGSNYLPPTKPPIKPLTKPPTKPQNIEEKEIYKEKEITVVSTTVDTHPPKPTIDEIQQYITDKGYTDIDAEAFWNFYESKNWMIGKNKMSKWKSAIATWHRKNLIEQKQKQNIKHTDNDTNQIDSQNRRLQDALLSTYYSMLGSQEAPRNEGLPDVPDILLG